MWWHSNVTRKLINIKTLKQRNSREMKIFHFIFPHTKAGGRSVSAESDDLDYVIIGPRWWPESCLASYETCERKWLQKFRSIWSSNLIFGLFRQFALWCHLSLKWFKIFNLFTELILNLDFSLTCFKNITPEIDHLHSILKLQFLSNQKFQNFISFSQTSFNIYLF